MARYTDERKFSLGNDNVVFRQIVGIKNKCFVKISRAIFDVDTFLYAYVAKDNDSSSRRRETDSRRRETDSRRRETEKYKIVIQLDKEKNEETITVDYLEENECKIEFESMIEQIFGHQSEAQLEENHDKSPANTASSKAMDTC